MAEKFTWVLRNSREHQDAHILKSELETHFIVFHLQCKHKYRLGLLFSKIGNDVSKVAFK